MFTNIIQRYCDQVSHNFNQLKNLSPTIDAAAQLALKTLNHHNKLIFCGNGGSAADSQHLAAELTGRYLKNRPALPAIAITTDTSAITAIGNDFGYEQIFSRQLEAIGKKNDLLFAISTSGNSKNIINVIHQAKKMDIAVIGLTGQNPAAIDELCDIIIKVPSNSTNHTQEMHIAIGHLLCGFLEDKLS